MNTYRSVTITMLGLLLVLLLAAIIFKPDNITNPLLVFLGLFFIMDTVYHINERKAINESRKFIFPYVDFSWRKQAVYVLLIITLTGVIYILYNEFNITVSLLLLAGFGLFLIRSLIFDRQTLQSIKVDDKYIEYGLGIFDVVKIDSIKSYSIDYEKRILLLHKARKQIRIRIKYLENIEKLDEVLKERIRPIT